MAAKLYTLVENEQFSWSLGQLGDLPNVDDVLSHSMWAIARLADEFPLEPPSATWRVARFGPVLMNDGSPVRILIRFVIRDREVVELLGLEVIGGA